MLLPMQHDKLFIPGPVEVSEKTWTAFRRPMIGHRGEAFKALYRNIHPRLQELFGTKQPVFLSTSSAWGVMEGAVRNVVSKRVLNCMCGAFSDKWLDVSRRCGKQAAELRVDWGRHIAPCDVILEQRLLDVAAVLNDDAGGAFHRDAERVPHVGEELEQAVQNDEDESRGDRAEERAAAVH